MAAPFLARVYRSPSGAALPYRLLVPQDLGNPLPLVVLLHGAGERGTDNQAQLRNGTEALLGSEAAQAQFPCIYLLPQCPPQARWVETDWGAAHHKLPATPSVPMTCLLELLPTLYAELPIDRDRVYLIGLSMGGYGVWDLLSRTPEQFAAAVAICGGGDEKQAERMRSIPIWAFHGQDDPVVPVERSRKMIEALRLAGGSPRYSELPGVLHDSWTSAFAEPELLPWLFSQRRS